MAAPASRRQFGRLRALINQAVGSNLGMANTALYPLANTSAYHDASSMGSDFEHVGLGSPNIDQMILALSHQTAGPPMRVVRLSPSPIKTNDLSPFVSLGVPCRWRYDGGRCRAAG